MAQNKAAAVKPWTMPALGILKNLTVEAVNIAYAQQLENKGDAAIGFAVSGDKTQLELHNIAWHDHS